MALSTLSPDLYSVPRVIFRIFILKVLDTIV